MVEEKGFFRLQIAWRILITGLCCLYFARKYGFIKLA